MKRYIIFDLSKNSYVSKNENTYVLHSDIENAHLFESKTAAELLCKSGLSKKIATDRLEVRKLDIELCNGGEKKNSKDVIVSKDNESSKYVFTVINDTLNKFNSRLGELQDELMKHERKICDIQHYIELNTGKLNACDGYKSYKMLQDALLDRRKVKDELIIIDAAMNCFLSSDSFDKISHKIEEMKFRTYKPRELTHLFQVEEI